MSLENAYQKSLLKQCIQGMTFRETVGFVLKSDLIFSDANIQETCYLDKKKKGEICNIFWNPQKTGFWTDGLDTYTLDA